MADQERWTDEELRDICSTTPEERRKWLSALHVSERTEKPTEDDMIRILNDLMIVIGES